MTKSKTNHPATSTTSSGVKEQLGAIDTGLASVNSLTAKERGQIRTRSKTVPDTLIAMVVQLAQKNGGLVAGIPFDVDGTNTTLTQVSDAQAAAGSSRSITRKLEDEAIQQRVVVADRVFGVYRALGRLVKTPEGNAFLGVYQEMATAVRNQPRLRRKSAAAASSATPSATAPASPSTPAPNPAAVAETAPAQVAAVPAAGGASHP